MAIPFIVAGVVASALGVGAKKAYDGYQDNELAGRIKERAERDHNNAKESLESAQEKMNKRSGEIGQLRLDIGNDIRELDRMAQELIAKLNSANPNGHKFNVNIPQVDFKKIKGFGLSAYEFTKGLATGAIAGGAMAYAAYGGTMAFAAASTGTAISSLSGVAATNAALASLGGGALSAGGFGIAGGTALLGGAVVAPALAVMAWKYASNAEENLDKARQIRDEAEEAVKKMNAIEEKVNDVSDYLRNVYVETDRLYDVFKQYYDSLKEMYELIIVQGNDAYKLSKEILLRVNNGYGVAAILTDVATVSLFTMKKSGDKQEVSIDSDNVPLLNKTEVDKVIASQKTAIAQF